MATQKLALAAEAKETETTAEFRGKKFKLPPSVDAWPLDVLEAFEDGKTVIVLRELLGPDQWAVVKSMKLKVEDFGELTKAIFAATGLDEEKAES